MSSFRTDRCSSCGSRTPRRGSIVQPLGAPRSCGRERYPCCFVGLCWSWRRFRSLCSGRTGRTGRTGRAGASLRVAVLGKDGQDGQDGKAGYIENLEILTTYDAYGGMSFGDVGPYQVITGIVHGKIDPEHSANAGIVDLRTAPTDGDGLVEYSEDVVILRPKSVANAKRVLFYDVVNRGNKVASGTFNGAGANFNAGQQGNALLLRLGYTIVWSGWHGET